MYPSTFRSTRSATHTPTANDTYYRSPTIHFRSHLHTRLTGPDHWLCTLTALETLKFNNLVRRLAERCQFERGHELDEIVVRFIQYHLAGETTRLPVAEIVDVLAAVAKQGYFGGHCWGTDDDKYLDTDILEDWLMERFILALAPV